MYCDFQTIHISFNNPFRKSYVKKQYSFSEKIYSIYFIIVNINTVTKYILSVFFISIRQWNYRIKRYKTIRKEKHSYYERIGLYIL